MTAPSRTKMTAADIQELTKKRLDHASARLEAKAPGWNASEAGANQSTASSPVLTSTIRLKVTDVATYERNPRQATHERIVELKESIRLNGIEQIVTVTKRPNTTRYVVAKGGNTRLLAAQALYDETKDPAFLYRDFLVIDYPGEATLLAAHLRENDQRADLCFWDKAKGYLELKAELEREAGAPLSLREFSRMLSEGGTSIGHVLLSTFKFAVDRLDSLGSAAVALTGRDVAARIQPRIGAITRLAVKLGRDDAWVQERLMEPELELARTSWERRGTLDVDRIIEAIHQRLADELLVTRAGLETMLGVADKVPQASGVELRATAVPQKQSKLFSTQPSSSGTEPERFTQRGATAIGSSSRVSREAERDRPMLPGAPGQGAAAPDTDAGHDEQQDIDQAQSVSGDGGVEHSHTPLHPATERSLDESPTHAGPRSGTTESVQERLWAALSRFVEQCGLTRSLRAAPPLPYGFMVEPPDLPDGAPLDLAATRDDKARHRYHGWWWLANLSQQNTPAGLAVVPDGSFARIIETDESWARACETHIGEPLLRDRFDLLVSALLNPDHIPGGLFFEVLAAARAFRDRHRSRFVDQFWREQGVGDDVLQLHSKAVEE